MSDAQAPETYECVGGPDDGDRVGTPTDGEGGAPLTTVTLIDGEYRLEWDGTGTAVRRVWRWYPAP